MAIKKIKSVIGMMMSNFFNLDLSTGSGLFLAHKIFALNHMPKYSPLSKVDGTIDTKKLPDPGIFYFG